MTGHPSKIVTARPAPWGVVLLMAGAWATAACTGATPEPYRAAAVIDSIMRSALHDGPLVGASVSVAEGGTPVFTGSYGLADVATGRPVTTDTRFNVASVGKIVAATTVLRLVDEGRMRLDAEVTDLLPELRGAPALEGVELRHLLDMTSGLPDYVDADFERWVATRQPLDPAFVLDHVRDHPRVFAPGAGWMYTNTGFYLAGMAVGRVVGTSWGDYVTGEVLPALGLAETGLCDEAGGARSVGYERSGTTFVPSVQDQETGVRGDAGLCATTADLAVLPARLRAGGVSAEALRLMTSATRLEDGTDVDYGVGVARGRLFGQELWGHMGGSGSIVAVLVHFEAADVSIAIAVNTRRASLGALVLLGQVAHVVLAPDRPGSPPVAPPGAPADSVLSALVGTYVGDRSRTTYAVRVEEGTLVRTLPGDPGTELRLLWRGGLDFGRADWPLDRFRFHVVEGRVTGFSAYYNGVFDGYYARAD